MPVELSDIFFLVGIKNADIGTAIKAGVGAGGIKDQVLAVCLIGTMFM